MVHTLFSYSSHHGVPHEITSMQSRSSTTVDNIIADCLTKAQTRSSPQAGQHFQWAGGWRYAQRWFFK